MTFSIAHLGPTGTHTETAALAYRQWLQRTQEQDSLLCPYASIAQTLKAVAEQEADFAVVPVENSTEGSVTVTLDTLWQLEGLQIQKALVLPITHSLLSQADSLDEIQTVYSHPQALAQCQKALEACLPQVQLVPTASTVEALHSLSQEPESKHSGAIASSRAAQLYNLPILISSLNDYPDNCTRFWVVGLQPATSGKYISLGFSTGANQPGALVRPLSVFAQREINLTRIESRPTKRSLGEYLFFIDIEGNATNPDVQAALEELPQYTEILKIFGNYDVLSIE
ncbi:MAG: prephenate dehydratase [Halothece sp. Uz-M2-17]|nr:prephenate dehydratase [Halothece sp. Uz-M2-17]